MPLSGNAGVKNGTDGVRLPWWTWVAPLPLFALGAAMSLPFNAASGIVVFSLSAPLGLVLVHWWGPRVLPAMLVNALLFAFLQNPSGTPWWPMFALPQVIVVGTSWFLYHNMRPWEGVLDEFDALRHLVMALLLPIAVGVLCGAGLRALWLQAPADGLVRAMGASCAGDLVGAIVLTLPLLWLVGPWLQRRGLAAGRASWPISWKPQRAGLAAALAFVALTLALMPQRPILSVGFTLLALAAAITQGLGAALLLNSWIIFCQVALPQCLPEPLSQAWASDADLTGLYLTTVVVYLAAYLAAVNLEVGRREAAYTRTLFETAPVAFFVHDPETGAILDVNGNTEEIYGYTRSELRGMSVAQVSQSGEEGSQSEAMARIRRAAAGVPQRFEWRARHHSGKVFWTEVTMALTHVFGQPRVLAAVLDISARKAAEEERLRLEGERQQAQKLEALGHLAGGVAHDFNNLLTGILGNLSLVETKQLDIPSREALGDAESAAERASRITRQLLAFSRRKSRQEIGPLDMTDLLADLRPMLAKMVGESLELRFDLPDSPMVAEASRPQMEQVLMNLVLNARDATPAGGHITVGVRSLLTGVSGWRGQHTLEGQWIELAVADTGVGIAPEVRAHIFEPFFSTKGPGKGTGMGLAVVFAAVREAGGHMAVESEPGRGSTFYALLPAGKPDARGEADTPLAAGRGSETLMLVEDEPAVRRALARGLKALGYTVLEAEGPREALRLAEAERGRFSMVISDMVMPDMNGLELVLELRRNQAGMKALLISGYADDMVEQEAIQRNGLQLLEKPFTAAALGARVRALLDA